MNSKVKENLVAEILYQWLNVSRCWTFHQARAVERQNAWLLVVHDVRENAWFVQMRS